jgi:hypothetical protein
VKDSRGKNQTTSSCLLNEEAGKHHLRYDEEKSAYVMPNTPVQQAR